MCVTEPEWNIDKVLEDLEHFPLRDPVTGAALPSLKVSSLPSLKASSRCSPLPQGLPQGLFPLRDPITGAAFPPSRSLRLCVCVCVCVCVWRVRACVRACVWTLSISSPP